MEMKKQYTISRFGFFLLALSPLWLMAQAQQATLLSRWDDPTVPGTTAYNNRYNTVWGFAVNGHEYAAIGSTMGTHIIDVTDPMHPFQRTFVPGTAQGVGIVHRDFKTYHHYLYGVSDEGASTLQIMDFSNLPDTLRLVYNSGALFERSHDISIDSVKGRLYTWIARGGAVPGGFAGMGVYDLSDPENPVQLNLLNDVETFHFGHVHDGYARNDTVYLNCGYDGFAVTYFGDPLHPKLLGALQNYPYAGYSHSGWPTPDGRYYFMADENHGYPMKTVDMQDYDDMEVIDTFNAESTPTSIPHNPVLACIYLYVAYYYDGLQVYDVSDPTDAKRVLYYDTSTEPDGQSYKGAWGVFPFLPSGNILISDMQNGLFVFKSIDDGCIGGPVGTVAPGLMDNSLKISPQPATDRLTVHLPIPSETRLRISLWDMAGRRLKAMEVTPGNRDIQLDLPPALRSGAYLLKVESGEKTWTERVIIAL